ncbi:hypothetical protein EDD36DRAFT_484453 [Exophiala viscosa]|uniref:Uncharacterized protein n=1 Tax=Exophiala viscosa TaxID=2486360 RepID=A0AAN6IGK1_9EURO|nr:hypothetical protein EDD36DRAFT_484453 [Exophiala viscosa]
MWRRNNNDPQLGYYVYPDADERYLETIPEVESLYSRASRRSSVGTALPELPFRAVPPLNDQNPIYSYDLDSSNPYSQNSTPEMKQAQETHREVANVSPISTQDSTHHNSYGSDGSLVSPVDSSFPHNAPTTHSQTTTTSQIPRIIPLAAPKSNREDVPKRWALQKGEDGATRWDEYSGEPNLAGKPPSARPGMLPTLEQQYPQLKERTRQILANLKEREAVKKANWGKVPPPIESDPLDHPVQRPPWKGASGRHAIVEPVKNNPAARTRPLMLVQRHKEAEDSQRSPTSEEDSIPPGKTPRSPIDAVSYAASTLPTVREISSDDDIKPVAPLKVRNTPRVVSPVPTENPRALDSPFRSPGPTTRIFELAASPVPSNVQEYGADSPTLGSVHSFQGPERSSSEESITMKAVPNPLQREPDSSSSWNTYASTTVAPQSPISRAEMTSSPIPRAELTGSPVSMTEQSAVPSPIALRKRVASNNSVQKSYDNSSSISPFSNTPGRSSSLLRKAIAGNEKPRAVSLMSGLSVSKSLPPTPVELEAADKAGSLEARLEDLARRKRNLHKIIAELRDSLKRNAIIYDARKRKEVDKMITNINMELQDVTNEEHEVSLRLYRVVKRRDKDEFYEKPTGLWIKRVTS